MTADIATKVKDKITTDRNFRRNLRKYFKATDAIMGKYSTPRFLRNISAGIALAKATINMMTALGLPDQESGEFIDWINQHDVELY